MALGLFKEKPPVAAKTDDFTFLEWFRKLQIYINNMGVLVDDMATSDQADEQIADLETLIEEQSTTQELLLRILLELETLNETLRGQIK